MQEHLPRHSGEKEPESHVMRKYPAWFGKRVTEKGHEFLLWYLAGTRLHLDGGHSESTIRRWQLAGCLPYQKNGALVRGYGRL